MYEKLVRAYEIGTQALNKKEFKFKEMIDAVNKKKNKTSEEKEILAFLTEMFEGEDFDKERKLIKAIKIDAKKKEIYEVVMIAGLDGLYHHIECETVDRFYLKNGDCCYVDEDVFNYETLCFFFVEGREIIGNGLLVGTDADGNDLCPTLALEEAKEIVAFPLFSHQKWVEVFFEEKEIDVDSRIKDIGYSPQEIFDYMSNLPDDVQDSIKETLVHLDILNGDIFHFLKHLASGLPRR